MGSAPQRKGRLYDVLGVPPGTKDEAELKKAYKKAAMKWHPDRHKDAMKEQANQKFQEIGEAYAILSDEQKRRLYDEYGEDLLKALSSGMTAQDFENAVEQQKQQFGGRAGGLGAFPAGAGGMPQGFGNGTFVFTQKGGRTSAHSAGVDARRLFEEMFGGSGGGFSFGGDDFASMESSGGMFGGSGAGSARGMRMDMDMDTDGSFGPFSRKRSAPQPEVQNVEIDLRCTLADLYTGTRKRMKVTRRVQSPSGGLATESKVIEIDVLPGWKEGTKITYEGAGDNYGNVRQNVVFVVKQIKHDVFERRGDDLHATVKLGLKEALLGGKVIPLTLPDGTVEHLKFSAGQVTQPGSRRIVSGKGMLNRKEQRRGDVIVKVDVTFPSSLDPRQAEAIARCF
ncbi:DnaJ-like subfamily B member 4 [Porphyridium purpureum]|uniref:DnaJ-like subfamily B member 4 n=1 Tax=Porphyridium purpureum TaxID=35688 RepID=A0A5J4Z0M1_PORPP|nr:DnaJ-like subfamily B member 4 [Porphyridium purpureum]|eukprot:POR0649..scf208_2